jgi:hypothetical protein
MLRIPQESEAKDFYGTGMGDEFLFQYLHSSSDLFRRSRPDLIPMVRQGVGTVKTANTVFFTASKLIGLNVLPTGRMSISYIFLILYFPI